MLAFLRACDADKGWMGQHNLIKQSFWWLVAGLSVNLRPLFDQSLNILQAASTGVRVDLGRGDASVDAA